jgi:hypothetical protein
MSTNDITGDKLTTGASTDKYREGWDAIFGKKPDPKPETPALPESKYIEADEGNTPD